MLSTRFDRRLATAALEALDKLSASTADHWWRELLSLWSPSGHLGELRLAIRNGSLNFYSNGQSIGQVSFDSLGNPRLRVHRKYVTGDPASGSGYITINHKGDSAHSALSEGFKSSIIREWVENSARHRGPEKCFVEKVVAESPTVIDLEMGLPAIAGQRSTLRMDIVALERHASETRIIFWEAKMIGDARLSSREHPPEVLRQLQKYEDYFQCADRQQAVIEAYRRNCRLLLDLHEMAVRISPKPELHSFIRKAAEPGSTLTLETKPRLLIFDDGKPRFEEKWKQRLTVLENSGTIVTVVPPASLILSPNVP